MSEVSVATRWVMETSRPLRLGTIFILYISQGVPIGLFWFAIPAWMAANGASAEDVAWVLGLTALPWSLKFVNGFIMDRYTILSMGRRRAWVIGAQLAMVLILLVAAFMQPAVDDILLLGIFGFVGNTATTFQDVAVDGMAVDLLEEEERARGGSMMFGGQLIGTAAATAAAGWAFANLGPSGAYVSAALLILAITSWVIIARERKGEKRLPWMAGTAHPTNLAIQASAWWPILKTTFISLLRPVSLFWIPILLTKGLQYGVLTGVTPLIGTGEAGWDEAQVSAVVATAQLIAGIVTVLVGGWIGDKLGAKWANISVLTTWLAFNAMMALTADYWANSGFVTFFIIAWFLIDTLAATMAAPISMRLSDPKVAATQFAIYMAMNNQGITLGALLLGMQGKLGGLVMLFPVLIIFNLIAIGILLTVRFPRRQRAAEPEVEPTLQPVRD